MKRPRLMVIGLDAVSLSLLDNFRAHCPTIRRQMARGVSGHAMPCFPIYTPTNWAALSTGADSSTTGAEGWFREIDGRRLSTFDRRAIACDTIFDSAARAGMSTLAISYPSAYPTKDGANKVLAPLNRGLVSNDIVAGKVFDVRMSNGIFAFILVEAPRSAAGVTVAKTVGATEDGFDAEAKAGAGVARQVHAYLCEPKPGRWKLAFRPDCGGDAFTLRNEVWSDPIPIKMTLPGRPGECVLRVMVFDNGRRLAISEAYDIGALGKPAALAREVYRKLGPPIEHSVFFGEMLRHFHRGVEDKMLAGLAREELQQQAKWIVDAASLVMKMHPYDVFYLHHHYPDNVMHSFLAAAEGVGDFTSRQRHMAREAIETCLEICDCLVAGLIRLAGRDTTILLVSDHGDVPNRYAASLANRLIETGLTVRGKEGKTDRTKSVAWPSERVGTWVEVNAERGTKRYEELQGAVIDVLLDWKTDASSPGANEFAGGERVVALALRRKDAHVLGYYGAECGDVVFHYNSGFFWGLARGAPSVVRCAGGANHGPQMPVTFSKLSDNMAFFVMTGPGVRRNLRWDTDKQGYIRLVDMVPTMCHISGVPAPRNVTGAVRYEFRG